MVSFIFLVLCSASVMLLALMFGFLGGKSRRLGWIAHVVFVPVSIVTALVLSVFSVPTPPPGEEGFVGDGMVGVMSITCWFFVAAPVIPAYYVRVWTRWSERRRLQRPPLDLTATG